MKGKKLIATVDYCQRTGADLEFKAGEFFALKGEKDLFKNLQEQGREWVRVQVTEKLLCFNNFYTYKYTFIFLKLLFR